MSTEEYVGDTSSRGAEIRPRPHPLRWVVALIVAFFFVGLLHGAIVNERFHWDKIGHYLFDSRILNGVVTTLWLTVVCMAIGTLLGTLMAVARLSPNFVLSGLAKFYIWAFRGTPVLVQLFLWFNVSSLYPTIHLEIPFTGLEFASFDANSLISRQVAAVLGLSLDLTAYMAEIIRGGIISVSEGQREAALAIGMTPAKAMARITLPQAIRTILPAAGNQFIALLKYTSLVSVLSVSDLLYSAQLIYNLNYDVMPLLLVACAWYLFITSVLMVLQSFVEKRFSRGASRQRENYRGPVRRRGRGMSVARASK